MDYAKADRGNMTAII